MAYRNKTYVAFDADNDIHYYRLMQAWKQSDYTVFNFFDAHELNRLLPTSNEETIKGKLRERLLNSKTISHRYPERARKCRKVLRSQIYT